MNERRIHQIFEASLLLKGAHALFECAGGLALAMISNRYIIHIVDVVTQDRPIEDHQDIILRSLLEASRNLTISTQHFYAFYLLSHGTIKILLVASLLKEWLWAYPASLAVLTVFIGYQLYRFSHTHGAGLIALTLFDAVVMGLIWHEYRLMRRHLAPSPGA
jgi:uncharacterized membrane protein